MKRSQSTAARGTPGLTAAQQRTSTLAPRARATLRQIETAAAAGDIRSASALWVQLSLIAPSHPETRRWAAFIAQVDGQLDRSIALLNEALTDNPDPDLLRLLADIQGRRGEHAESLRTLRQAATCTVHATDWLTLGIAFDQQGHSEDALATANQALTLQPHLSRARLLRIRCLQALGQAAAAATDCRYLIEHKEEIARAWFSLLELKTESISSAELVALTLAERQSTAPIEERSLLTFALGRAYESFGMLQESLATIERANQTIVSLRPWNAARFSNNVKAIRETFTGGTQVSSDRQGREVIFLVGLPRSGSTLFEQVLAAHPQVEAASELPYLDDVLARESRRRQRPLAQWAGQATPADWSRLGRDYLALSARWRTDRPIATDKLPSNWLLAGAALAMLPEARIVDCRRDALETCWSCYKQLFAAGKADFSYDFDNLAAYSRDYRDLADFWSQRFALQFRTFHYEHLVADSEAGIRQLLDFCQLPFDPNCLRPHEAQRSIRTASAAQVRQPIQQGSARSDRYGALLDPLRRCLETVGASPAPHR